MLFARVAATSASMAATSSRIAKRAAVAGAVREAAAGPVAGARAAELALVVTYLSGTLRQRRTGVGWASLTDLPAPAATPELTVSEVDAAFERIAALGGPGSAADRSAAVAALFARATADEQQLLRGLVSDDVRQGALDALVQDGVAEAYGVPATSVRRAAMLLGSTAAAATVLDSSGQAGLDAVSLRVGQPVRPMLAASAPSPADAAVKVGLPAVVDTKLDGIRVQIHRDGDKIQVYTRSLDDITARVPEIVATVAGLPVDRVVLDGEVLAIGADARPLPFQVSASRTMSRVDETGPADQVALSLFCFDLLHLDGRDTLDEPLSVRTAVMAATLPPELIVGRVAAGTADEVAVAFEAAVAAGFEGVVVKKPGAPYAAGRRDSGWVKVKPRHTLDLAVVGAEWGYGRREGWLSNLHLAARDPRTGELVMLGKTFKGLTDAVLAWQTEQLLAREVRRTRSTVLIDPPLVVEIAFDGVQTSTRYPGGVALRFARVVRYRDDKTPDEVDSLDAVTALAPPSSSPENGARVTGGR